MKGTLQELSDLLKYTTNDKEYNEFMYYLVRIHKFNYNKIINGFAKYKNKKNQENQQSKENKQENEKPPLNYKNVYISQNLSKDEIYKIRELFYKNNSYVYNKEKEIQNTIEIIKFLKGICNIELSMSEISNILEINQTQFRKIIKFLEKENIVITKKIKRYQKGNNYKIIVNLKENTKAN